MKQDGGRGIAIAVPKKYEKICLSNIQKLRELGCEYPIEIWEVGEEMTKAAREEFAAMDEVHLKKVDDYCDNPNHWKGYQIKAFILLYSSFTEVLICDADVYLHQHPKVLFEDEHYLTTGTYFFKDLEKWQFSKLTDQWEQLKQKLIYKKFKSAAFFQKRKNWLRGLLPEKKSMFPTEWDYMYADELPSHPVKEALQESGVVVMDKEKNKEAVKCIYELNDNHKETYQYVWGDKETFWIGCVMTDTDLYFNPTSGYMSEETGKLTHDYNGQIFFSQKG